MAKIFKYRFCIAFCIESVELTKNTGPDKFKHSEEASDSILVQNFHLQLEVWEKMSLLFN